ncbi:hypothetical protein pVco5_130 [Vibrio phage pVco-5]|uniref:Uncharacterized protein n=1 Tax=Vibrio phage pVco-5 TaxID=1965485 RepID=A0A1W6JUX5_9CAUD|nr:hypothetical protein KNT61_gp105 [Vibrio phage pVco-5]ARM71093.1 hypothetical protein pVco5_130 [Vibrio phage pVco-5]
MKFFFELTGTTKGADIDLVFKSVKVKYLRRGTIYYYGNNGESVAAA